MSTNIMRLIIGFLALFVAVAAAGMLLMYIKQIGSGNLSNDQIITYFVVMLIMVVLVGALASYIYTLL